MFVDTVASRTVPRSEVRVLHSAPPPLLFIKVLFYLVQNSVNFMALFLSFFIVAFKNYRIS